MAESGDAVDTAERAAGLAAHFATRGIALTSQQAEELAAAAHRLDRMKAIVRAAASTAAAPPIAPRPSARWPIARRPIPRQP